MKSKCLIIDDELHARNLIKSYIDKIYSLEFLAEFDNALASFQFLQHQQTDLLFLDIQMPGITGLDLIRSLHHRPAVILTTAYREYGFEGFELDVVDYLLKPISFDRFLKSVSKFQHLDALQLPTKQMPSAPSPGNAYMFFKVNKDMVKVFLKDILYIEGIKDYIRICTTEKSYITYQRLGHLEETLPEDKFSRCHKSYIVSLENIKSYNHEHVKLATAEIPIGRVYRKAFMESLDYFQAQNSKPNNG